jgi:hypothetical protein
MKGRLTPAAPLPVQSASPGGCDYSPFPKPNIRRIENNSVPYGINSENSFTKHARLVLRLIVPPNLAEIHFSLA